jgi:hypothetical protein
MYFSETLGAGAANAKEITEAGDFFRILASAAEDLTVTFYRAGREVGTVQAVGAGYSEKIDFDKVRFFSAAGGVVSIVTRIGAEVGYDRAVGSVQVSGTITTKEENGAFTQTAPAVGTGSTLILAANPNRRYLNIQNNHGTAVVRLHVDGNAASGNTGLKLNPGTPIEIQGRAPTGAIYALSSVAIAANVGDFIVVEG